MEKTLNIEIDTGVSPSVMSEKMYQELWGEGGQPPLVKKGVVLRTYTGKEVRPKGLVEDMVSCEGK